MNDAERAALTDFDNHVEELAEDYGLELDGGERQRILMLSIANGFSPQATIDAFTEIYGDVDADIPDEPASGVENLDKPLDPPMLRLVENIDEDFKSLSDRLGRKLLESEKAEYVKNVEAQLSRTGGTYDRDKAAAGFKSLGDFSSQEKNEWMHGRIKDEDPEPEVDPNRVFDMDNDKDRVDYMVARAQGHEFDDAPDEPEPEAA
jgi:hypothetical protein